jgi:hypothetical protein
MELLAQPAVGLGFSPSERELRTDLIAAAADGNPMLIREFAGLWLLADASPSSIGWRHLVAARDLGDEVAAGMLNLLPPPAVIQGDRPTRAELQALATIALPAAPAAERVCDSPAIFALEGFLSRLECVYLISHGAAQLRPALVDRDVYHPEIWRADARRFDHFEDLPFLALLARKIATALGYPDECKSIRVIRYGPGGEFKPHYDSIPGDRRAVSAILYLSDDYVGGETSFPRAGVRFRGDAGDLLFFHNYCGDKLDRNAMHAGLPVVSGEKWIATGFYGQTPKTAEAVAGAAVASALDEPT